MVVIVLLQIIDRKFLLSVWPICMRTKKTTHLHHIARIIYDQHEKWLHFCEIKGTVRESMFFIRENDNFKNSSENLTTGIYISL